MAGVKAGIATEIVELESRVFMHCYGHDLSDTTGYEGLSVHIL